MDINYLLWLQEIRDGMGTFIPEFFLKLSSLAVSVWPVILIAFVFWVFDRNGGRRLFGALSLSLLLNGFLKGTFNIYRPWIRDSRIEPYGNAKAKASGYSFPSGHTMFITPTAGGIGLWQWKKNKVISIICFVIVLLVMFSRNFLGCHTPQDIIVGLIMGLLSIFIAGCIEKWTDAKPGRDKTCAIIAAGLGIALAFYYLFKPYPMDYLEDGTLIADPYTLAADCFEGIGCIIAFYFARIIERNGFDFDKEMHWKDRFIISVFAIIPIFLWRYKLYPVIEGWNLYVGKFLNYSVEIFYCTAAVPWLMGIIHKWGILNRDSFS